MSTVNLINYILFEGTIYLLPSSPIKIELVAFDINLFVSELEMKQFNTSTITIHHSRHKEKHETICFQKNMSMQNVLRTRYYY